ncbi:hypothetical protein HMPREF9688_03347 [Klebsiella oxytoca 10-5244]|nr:hypothetical protein HMPREF1569_2248 [Klebsiella oxytoca OK-1]KMV90548.1 hypothetical protein HMPREF9688_03347 [Klebsiella oxytoca 10-5244]
MSLAQYWKRWSGWFYYLAAVSAWLFLLAVIFREGWIK